MKFTKDSGVGGAWIDKKTLKTGDLIKLVSEAQEVPNQQGGKQIVAKARIKGQTEEAKNLSINKPSKNALIEAFGEDSKNWVNQLLTANVEKTLISGKRGVALYLIPEGFELGEDSGGYVVIKKIGEDKQTTSDGSPMPFPNEPENEINLEDSPW